MRRPLRPGPSLLLLALCSALLPTDPAAGAGIEGGSAQGPPAFVPLESPEALTHLRAAAALAAEGRAPEAAQKYQDLVDGPLADRLAALEADPDTLERARDRALREVAARPAVLAAWRDRFEATAGRLAEDPSRRRQAFDRFPLAAAGARAGLLLAREAHRRGRSEEALGVLDRLRDLQAAGGEPARGAPAPGEVLALAAAAAADGGDREFVESLSVEAAPLRDGPGPGGGTLGAFLDRCRAAAAAAPPPAGPRGPLVLKWLWRPEEADLPPDADAASLLPAYGNELPPRADHLVAVRDGVVYWTDRLRVTALDLATGEVRGRSDPVSSRTSSTVPTRDHLGETFAPAADGEGILAALDISTARARGRRTGALHLFDRTFRLLARRGGEGDLEHPEMAGRFVFHGRPLLLGDRVYVAATESQAVNVSGDVRTHLLCFRRSDLEPLWDTFLSYGSGIHASEVAPAGSPVHRHGRLYIATHTGLEACVDALTGSVLWAHRYRTPEMAEVPRLSMHADMTSAPVPWYECPPAFSGDLVAFAPRDSYHVEFLFQRPVPATGRVRLDEMVRPRLDNAAMTTLWVLPGPAGKFFLAGQSSGPDEAPLCLRDLDGAAESQVPWRGPIMEPTVAGLPVRTRDALYLATEKAIYRVPYPGRDGEIEVLATLPPLDPVDPRPRAGNLVVLPDAILSVADDGILCFAPPRPTTPK